MSSVYAASCNPSRRAKQHNPPILPMPSSATTTTTTTSTDAPPVKRGRKPGTLSRSARETQRKLNHSIIEKARRTKINDALASLKVLVPHNYSLAAVNATTTAVDQDPSEDDADDDDDKDGDYGSRSAGKAKGNKKQTQPKEPKEFKLEILVRTVAYMQFLLQRVGELEETLRLKEQQQEERVVERCKTCLKQEAQSREEQKKGKEKMTDKKRKRPVVDEDEPIDVVDEQPRKVTSPCSRRERLPSISSWLPNCLPPSPPFHPSHQPSPVPYHAPYLPSPPASSQFTPTIPVPLQMPPALSLGPSADVLTRSISAAAAPTATSREEDDLAEVEEISNSPRSRIRTPEEESAATLLLHMSSSPVFLPQPGPSGDAQATPSPINEGPSSGGEAGLGAGERNADGGRKSESVLLPPPPSPPPSVIGLDAHLLPLAMMPNLVAQTPSSILGLRKRRG